MKFLSHPERSRRIPLARALGALLVAAGLLGIGVGTGACHLDGAIFTAADDEAHFRPPTAPPTTLAGQFAADSPYFPAGGQVQFFLADGARASDLGASINANGVFSTEIPGTLSFTNLVVFGVRGSISLLAIFPEVEGAAQVYDFAKTVELRDAAPLMNPLDEVSTVLTLLLDAKARADFGSLSSLSPEATLDTMQAINARLGDEPFLTVQRMTAELLDAATTATGGQPVFTPPDRIEAVGSSLNPDFLASNAVDYDGNGRNDSSTAAWDAALAAAIAEIQFDVCYDPDLVTTVFQLDFNGDGLDGNCQPIDRDRWLVADSGDSVFITGAVHEDMVRCSDEPDYEYCATEADVRITNDALGNFVPNRIALFDDGTNGDAQSGDGVYTRAFELPRGMRIGYKYTFGTGGEGWTGTEEWPGNSRLIELVDVTGDEIIVRRDIFGDESTNKDRANSLSPARGGRGSISWETDANDDGLLDAREITIDADADCTLDDFPPVGPNEPLTVECRNR